MALRPPATAPAHDVTTGLNASGIAYGDGGVWVASAIDGTLVRIDPATERTRRYSLGSTPTAVAVSGAGVLVTTIGGGPATAAGSNAPAAGSIKADSCGRVIYAGPGRPRFVIAADLNLGIGDNGPYTQGMAQAIEYELQAHHFRAGRYRLGLQVCDDSTPQSGSQADPPTCTANAKAYVATATVIGVIGVQSACAWEQVAALNRVGPLAMVTMGSQPGLTIDWPGSQVRAFYPTGTRNLVRVAPRDDLQGVAGAEFAKRLGLHRMYDWLEYPGDFLGSNMAPPFRNAARRLGIRVIGPAWPSGGFRALGRRLAARGVDGVFVAGFNDVRGLKFIRAMRDTLGPNVTLIGPKDSFWLPPNASAADRVAERGMYLVGGDLSHPAAQLPPAGRAFVAAFRASPPVGADNLWAPYGAQATDMLLAAIARSEGTRASVVRELFRARVSGGILGNFAVAPFGDLDPTLVIIDRTTARPPGTKPVTTIRVPPSSG